MCVQEDTEKVSLAAGEAVPAIRTNMCIFCTLGLKPTKMKRQYVHHIPREGRIVVCMDSGIKLG